MVNAMPRFLEDISKDAGSDDKKAQPLEEAEFADPQNSLARFDYVGFLYTAVLVDVPPEGLDESLATPRKAAAIFESEARAQPGMHRYQQAMADVSLSIGKRLFELGRYREATAELHARLESRHGHHGARFRKPGTVRGDPAA